MPDPTPQEARELIADARREYAAGTQNFSAEEVGALLSLLDEAERVLEPFARLAEDIESDGHIDTGEEVRLRASMGAEVFGAYAEVQLLNGWYPFDTFRASRSLLLKLKGPDHG